MVGNHKTELSCTLPDPEGAIVSLVGQIERVGGSCWIVGGAVRDLLLGARRVHDWDLVTDLTPEQLLQVCPAADARDAALGTVRIESSAGCVTLTTLREESGYADYRHPDRVEFVTDPARDATRRDFTCNALYVALDSEGYTPGVGFVGRVVDPTGGIEDLRRRQLRAIGSAAQRVREDPLRMLRAVRFAARHRLRLEDSLGAALRENASLLDELSTERIYAELTAAFSGARGRGAALRLLVGTGLAVACLPEVVDQAGVPQPPQYHPEGDVLTHVCLVLDHCPPNNEVLAWSAVLHDVGKPATFERAADRIRFSGHDVLSAKLADGVLRRFRVATAVREAVVEVCRDHIRFASLLAMRPRRRERWLRSENFRQHLAFHRADCSASHNDLHIYHAAERLLESLPPEPPPALCTGADVLARGVAQGPMVGRVLAELEAELDESDAPNREHALSRLDAIVARAIKAGG